MVERRGVGAKENLILEIQALRDFAQVNGGLRVPGRPAKHLWAIARIDENAGLAFLIRAEGGIRESKENMDVHELLQFNLKSASDAENIPMEVLEVEIDPGVHVVGGHRRVDVVRAVEGADGNSFNSCESIGDIIDQLHVFFELEDSISFSGVDSDTLITNLATIQSCLNEELTIPGSLLAKIPVEKGLQEAVLRAIRPDFSEDENLYAIQDKLVKSKLQHDEFREAHIVFMKKGDGKEFDVDNALTVLGNFIDILGRDKDAEIPENSPDYKAFTSNYGLQKAVRKAVLILTAKTGPTTVPIE